MSGNDPLALVGVVLEGRYRIDSVVGEGGFGVVYGAFHLGFGAAIAVKALKLPLGLRAVDREQFLRAFEEEGNLLFGLSKKHAAFVQVIDKGVLRRGAGEIVPYLALEWLDGESLGDVLAREHAEQQPPRSLAETIDLLTPIAEALSVAHGERIAHRDVNPANIVVLRGEGPTRVKLLDLGVAKVMSVTASAALKAPTTPGFASGFTMSYGAPEQWHRRYGATGPWTDVFGLAIVCVELMTGERALEGDEPSQLMGAAIAPERPTPNARGATVATEVDAVFRVALAAAVTDRYRSAREFWDALTAAAGILLPRRLGRAADLPAQVPIREATSTHLMPSPEPTHSRTEPSLESSPGAHRNPLAATEPQAPRTEGTATAPLPNVASNGAEVTVAGEVRQVLGRRETLVPELPRGGGDQLLSKGTSTPHADRPSNSPGAPPRRTPKSHRGSPVPSVAVALSLIALALAVIVVALVVRRFDTEPAGSSNSGTAAGSIPPATGLVVDASTQNSTVSPPAPPPPRPSEPSGLPSATAAPTAGGPDPRDPCCKVNGLDLCTSNDRCPSGVTWQSLGDCNATLTPGTTYATLVGHAYAQGKRELAASYTRAQREHIWVALARTKDDLTKRPESISQTRVDGVFGLGAWRDRWTPPPELFRGSTDLRFNTEEITGTGFFVGVYDDQYGTWLAFKATARHRNGRYLQRGALCVGAAFGDWDQNPGAIDHVTLFLYPDPPN